MTKRELEIHLRDARERNADLTRYIMELEENAQIDRAEIEQLEKRVKTLENTAKINGKVAKDSLAKLRALTEYQRALESIAAKAAFNPPVTHEQEVKP